MKVDPTSRLRMWGYCLVLTALAFVQAPGRIVGDTKFDLVADPLGFLARAAGLWDPQAAFGQVQNQAYGYFWPMGPFFALCDVLGLPAWVTQRLWWSLLLCLAFVGTVKVARALGLGRPWSHVVAGFAFALSAHVITLIGPTSVEAWPTAWAPWVLLPLVHASREGSVRRGAALSALAVAMCGGVNAVAVSAVLVLPAIWLVTRERGRRRTRLALWWVLFIALATLWWVVPLLLFGRYSVPFLDYIENAPITTLPTSLPDIFGGTSDWVAYIAIEDWAAGHLLGTTPILLVNAAVVAGAGLAGIVHPANPHRHFLFLGVLAGVALIGFGYTGPLHGWWAQERLALLDAELAPFRNLHKYDVVLRLSLVLGLAHILATVGEHVRATSRTLPSKMAILAVVVSVAGLAVPAYAGRLPPTGAFDDVPDYWQQTADYLAQEGRGTALLVPASAFGDYRWGKPHDDVLQPLAASPWAVRNVIPLAQPGNVRLLDAITRELERGRPSPRLAGLLADNGVGHLVVRNDIHPFRSGPPDPVVLHQALNGSPGIRKVAEFGPPIGGRAVSTTDQDVRVVLNRGRQEAYAAVEVYAVDNARGKVSAWTADSVPVVAGEPGAALADRSAPGTVNLTRPTVLVGDRARQFRSGPTVLTDGLRRREMAFTAVRENESATMTEEEPWVLSSVEPNHRLYDRQSRYETHAQWAGVASVQASSAQSQASALPPIRPDRLPAAAIDGDRSTEWVSTGVAGAVGQWWRVIFEAPREVPLLRVTAGTTRGPDVTRLRIVTDLGVSTVTAPAPGRSATYELPAGLVSFVELQAVRVRGGIGGQFALAEVTVPGVFALRFLALPDVFEDAPRHILLSREVDRPACAVVNGTTACDDIWLRHGEEKESIQRVVPLPGSAPYTVDVTASPIPSRVTAGELADSLPIRVQTSKPLSQDVRASGLATLDGDPRTAWVAAPGVTPSIRLSWAEPVTLRAVDVEVARTTPGARPLQLLLVAGRESRTVDLRDGGGRFRPLVTDEVLVQFPQVELAYSLETGRAIPLTVGVGELSFPGAALPEVDADDDVDHGCGSGPTVSVNGQSTQTRVVMSLSDLMSGESVSAQWCGDGPVPLREGDNVVQVLPSTLVKPDSAMLTLAGAPTMAPRSVPVDVEAWGGHRRVVRVADHDEPALLVVSENINAGWSATLNGRELTPQRVDGWRQGWIVPPGVDQVVRLEFTPQKPFRTALLGGVDALLVVVAAAMPWGRRRRYAALGTSACADRLVAVAALLLGGLVAGWVGFVAFAAAVFLGNALRARIWAPYVAGAALALAGLAHAAVRAGEEQVPLELGQALGLTALSIAVAGLGAKGPAFLRRRKGRSRT